MFSCLFKETFPSFTPTKGNIYILFLFNYKKSKFKKDIIEDSNYYTKDDESYFNFKNV